MGTQLSPNLLLDRCPHCRVDKPNLNQMYTFTSVAHDGYSKRIWGIYQCKRCGGIVTAAAPQGSVWVNEIYPGEIEVDNNIPVKAKAFLDQALNSIHAPSGAVMLAASSVDAMLKEKSYKNGKLYGRINEALKNHLITKEMAD